MRRDDQSRGSASSAEDVVQMRSHRVSHSYLAYSYARSFFEPSCMSA